MNEADHTLYSHIKEKDPSISTPYQQVFNVYIEAKAMKTQAQ